MEVKAERNPFEMAKTLEDKKNIKEDPIMQKKVEVKSEWSSQGMANTPEDGTHIKEDPMIYKKMEVKAGFDSFEVAETSEDKKHIKEDPTIEKNVEFKACLNSRGMTEVSVEGQHVSIENLKKHIEEDSTIWKKICDLGRWNTDGFKSKAKEKPRIIDYLDNDVPKYPTPVEFHVSNIAHVTTEEPFNAILESEQVKPPGAEYSWWTLAINAEEIKSAEKLYLQEKNMTGSFLNEFTTSPAFQHDTSRYGTYRLTFPLTELMERYQEQSCGGKEPVLRVFKTMFYKQEIVYAVLIHRPQDNEHFEKFPLLEDNGFVYYQNGQIIWRAQAISSVHQCTLTVDTSEDPPVDTIVDPSVDTSVDPSVDTIVDPSVDPSVDTSVDPSVDTSVDLSVDTSVDPSVDTYKRRLKVKRLWSSTYYVWDNVCLAFHLPDQEALKVPRKRLIEAFDACKLQEKNLLRYIMPEMLFKNAETRVNELKKELEKGPEHQEEI